MKQNEFKIKNSSLYGEMKQDKLNCQFEKEVITQEEIVKLQLLQKRVFKQIKKCLEGSSTYKSYEGQFSIVFPNYFKEEEDTDRFILKLDLYIFGPCRHYSWDGNSLMEAIDKAEKDIDEWIEIEKELGEENNDSK